MKLTYIYHSGMAIEGDGFTIVFDFWKDPARVIPSLLERPGKLYVLSSHFHEDHFNPEVLAWRAQHADICYLFSKDILKHKRTPREAADAWLAKGATFDDGRVKVTAFGSTDVGVSWMVEVDGKKIFHAGDLNNWHWQDESTDAEISQAEKQYLGELKDIRKQYTHMDVAMVPVDARIGSDYARGARQFVEQFTVGLFVPMHFSADGFASIQPFAEVNAGRYWCISSEGESIQF